MKPIKNQLFAFLFIFLFLNQDLVIEVQAKRFFLSQVHLLNEQLEKIQSSNRDEAEYDASFLETESTSKNSSNTHPHRLKTHKDKSVTKFDPFGITFLVLLAVLIVFTIYKYCLNQKIKKALAWLANEKNKIRVEKYHLRIKEGMILTDFCLSYQKISHLFKSHEVMTKIYEQDLQDAVADSEALKTKKVNGNSLPKNHVSKVRNLASFILAKKRSLSSPSVSHLMVENCYNTFKQRQDYTESTQRRVEEKKEPEYEAIGSLEEVMAAADYTVSSVIKDYKENGKEAALWTADPEQAEIPQKIKDLIEDPNKKEPFEIWKAKDENWQAIQPTEWVFAGATLGDSVKTLAEAAELFTTLTDKKASWAKKIIATLGWLFKLSNGVIGSITEVQKVSGAEHVLDFPFLSLGTSLTNLAEKIRLYINARAAWNKEKVDVAEKEKRNPAKKLEESLAFWDMMDDGIDLLQSIASTVLYILAPMTAGLSQVVNTAMKLVVCWIHIGLGHWKLHVINKMKDRIVTYYENERKKQRTQWDEFRGKLVSQKCGQVHTLIKTFIEKEFDEIEDALENTQGWVNNIAANTQMTDDNVKQNVEKILTVVCDSDPENCLEFVNRLKLDLKTIRSLNSETGEKVYTISKWTKFGPINSAYMVTKLYVENIFENDDFKNYVANAQNKLLIHGYYPTFQTYQYDLFTCRLCGNPYYQMDKVEFGVEFTSLLSKISDVTPTGIKTGKSVIQESVETYSKTDRENEITRYFVAHFAEIKPEGWREFTASNIVPLPGKNDLDHKFILEEGDFMESLNHNQLSICTTKLKRLDGLLKIIKRNKEAAAKLREDLKKTGGNWGVEGSLSILQTVYSNNEFEKGGKAHQFAHVLISHMEDRFTLTDDEKKQTNCVLIDGIFAIRHHHFSLHIARNSATVKDGDENTGNIPEESLQKGGWTLFKGPLEMTYFEKRNFLVSDKTYRWVLNIYSKEVLNLRAATTTGVAQISFLKQTLDNIYELKDKLKKEFIEALTQLYCVDECKSFDDKNPLTFTRIVKDKKQTNPFVSYSMQFCKLATTSSITFGEFIEKKANLLIKSIPKANPIRNELFKNMCPRLNQIASTFNVQVTFTCDA